MITVGTSETGEIIGRDEAPFVIVRQWARIESEISIAKLKRYSGLSNRFIEFSVNCRIFTWKSTKRPVEKKIPSKDRFFCQHKETCCAL